MFYNPSMDEFDDLVYSAPHPGTLNYMQQKLNSLSTNLTAMGQQFMSNVRSQWEQFNGSEAMRRMRAAKRKIGDALFMRNEVQALSSLGELQNAQSVMQNIIMSEPTIRSAFYHQRLDGFSATYRDPNPGLIGEDDPLYRKVMSGMVVDDPETGDWKCTIYVDDFEEGDKPFDIDQKVDAQITWEMVKHYWLRGKEDPTSQSGGYL